MCQRFCRCLSVVAALALFAGCQTTPRPQFSGDPRIDVSKFSTFWILEFDRSSPLIDDEVLKILEIIETYMADVLIEKGYTLAATMEEADFVVAPRGRSVPSTTVAGAQFGTYGAGTWISGTPWGTSSANKESLTIMVIVYAQELERIAWTGWFQARSSQRPRDKLRNFQDAATALSNIINEFPTRTP
jgi:hypothetical protein